jgi:hypothetical protein
MIPQNSLLHPLDAGRRASSAAPAGGRDTSLIGKAA